MRKRNQTVTISFWLDNNQYRANNRTNERKNVHVLSGYCCYVARRHLFAYKLTTKQNKDHNRNVKSNWKCHTYSLSFGSSPSPCAFFIPLLNVAWLSLAGFICVHVISRCVSDCFRYLYSCQSISLSNVSKWRYRGISLHQTYINFRFISCTTFIVFAFTSSIHGIGIEYV